MNLRFRLRVVACRYRYWMGKVFKIFGVCFLCKYPLAFTRSGVGICSNCKKRY